MKFSSETGGGVMPGNVRPTHLPGVELAMRSKQDPRHRTATNSQKPFTSRRKAQASKSLSELTDHTLFEWCTTQTRALWFGARKLVAPEKW